MSASRRFRRQHPSERQRLERLRRQLAETRRIWSDVERQQGLAPGALQGPTLELERELDSMERTIKARELYERRRAELAPGEPEPVIVVPSRGEPVELERLRARFGGGR